MELKKLLTRFDQSKQWGTSNSFFYICNMETTHIINTINYLMRKPNMIMSMLIQDVDKSYSKIWSIDKTDKLKRKSINNITSLDNDDLINYFIASPLMYGFKKELKKRGVNFNNILNLALDQND